MNNKSTQKGLRSYYTENLPISSMALSYLFEIGRESVLSIDVEDFTAQIAARIAEAESSGGIYIFTLETALSFLEMAKELAKYSHIDIISALADEITGKDALRRLIDTEAPFRIFEVLGVQEDAIDEDSVDEIADALEDESDIMFDYDAIDDFLREQLKERGIKTCDDN